MKLLKICKRKIGEKSDEAWIMFESLVLEDLILAKYIKINLPFTSILECKYDSNNNVYIETYFKSLIIFLGTPDWTWEIQK